MTNCLVDQGEVLYLPGDLVEFLSENSVGYSSRPSPVELVGVLTRNGHLPISKFSPEKSLLETHCKGCNCYPKHTDSGLLADRFWVIFTYLNLHSLTQEEIDLCELIPGQVFHSIPEDEVELCEALEFIFKVPAENQILFRSMMRRVYSLPYDDLKITPKVSLSDYLPLDVTDKMISSITHFEFSKINAGTWHSPISMEKQLYLSRKSALNYTKVPIFHSHHIGIHPLTAGKYRGGFETHDQYSFTLLWFLSGTLESYITIGEPLEDLFVDSKLVSVPESHEGIRSSIYNWLRLTEEDIDLMEELTEVVRKRKSIRDVQLELILEDRNIQICNLEELPDNEEDMKFWIHQSKKPGDDQYQFNLVMLDDHLTRSVSPLSSGPSTVDLQAELDYVRSVSPFLLNF
jgi:hypothetical protein